MEHHAMEENLTRLAASFTTEELPPQRCSPAKQNLNRKRKARQKKNAKSSTSTAGKPQLARTAAVSP